MDDRPEPSQHKVVVRDLQPGDVQAWRRLWAGYLTFYKVDLAEDVTAYTISQLLEGSSPVSCCVAEVEGELIGFVIWILHPSTWSNALSCYLEDLFVEPSHRREGAGRALIEEVIDRARQNGWAKVYWHTHSENRSARALYDQIASVDAFVRYTKSL